MTRTILVGFFLSLYILVFGPPLLLYTLLSRDPNPLYHAGIGGVMFFVRAAGVRLRVRGLERIPRGPCLFAANHTSTLNTQATAIRQWNSADNTLNAEMKKWTTKVKACDSGSAGLPCATAAAAQAATYMSAFASRVQAIAMPSGAASAAAAKTVTDATRTSGDFTTVSRDTTLAQYQADMASSGLSPDLDDLQTDINNVAAALENSGPTLS